MFEKVRKFAIVGEMTWEFFKNKGYYQNSIQHILRVKVSHKGVVIKYSEPRDGGDSQDFVNISIPAR